MDTLGTFFQKAEYTQDSVKVALADGKEFEAKLLLVAIGRGPVSASLPGAGRRNRARLRPPYARVHAHQRPDHLRRR
ncbi:hypothetical protein SANTM175S_03965 [Streptomyces antimycoticus]